MMQDNSDFSSVLISKDRSAEIPGHEDFYGNFIGNWDVEVTEYAEDGSHVKSEGSWAFSRVLEGRAIQDVFIVPKQSLRSPGMSKTTNRYGSTIRTYNKEFKTWNINWYNPVTGVHNELTAARIGNEIIQEGIDANGNPIRWSFTDIETNSFRWLGEVSEDKGKTWKLTAEFIATRKR